MAGKTELFHRLRDSMGLNAYESKVWTSLLGRGIASAGELADISGVPRSRCYDVLETLEKKGFVFQKIGKPIKYIAIPPDEAVETMKKISVTEEKRILSLLEEIKQQDIFEELQSLYSNGINYVDNNDISSSIVGKHNINLFLKDRFASAEKSIIIHTSEKGLKRNLKLIKKSVKSKVGVSIHAPVNNIAVKSQNVKLGKKTNDMRFVNIDDSELIIFTSPDNVDPEYESALWVKSKFMIDSMKSFIA